MNNYPAHTMVFSRHFFTRVGTSFPKHQSFILYAADMSDSVHNVSPSSSASPTKIAVYMYIRDLLHLSSSMQWSLNL